MKSSLLLLLSLDIFGAARSCEVGHLLDPSYVICGSTSDLDPLLSCQNAFDDQPSSVWLPAMDDPNPDISIEFTIDAELFKVEKKEISKDDFVE